MEYDEEKDEWIGTPIEHLEKLLITHNCFCSKVKELIETIIKQSKEGINNSNQHKQLDEFVKELKKGWRIKARRMDIMAKEGAIFELEATIQETLKEVKGQ